MNDLEQYKNVCILYHCLCGIMTYYEEELQESLWKLDRQSLLTSDYAGWLKPIHHISLGEVSEIKGQGEKHHSRIWREFKLLECPYTSIRTDGSKIACRFWHSIDSVNFIFTVDGLGIAGGGEFGPSVLNEAINGKAWLWMKQCPPEPELEYAPKFWFRKVPRVRFDAVTD